jgi:hypothetical protein
MYIGRKNLCLSILISKILYVSPNKNGNYKFTKKIHPYKMEKYRNKWKLIKFYFYLIFDSSKNIQKALKFNQAEQETFDITVAYETGTLG